MKPYVIFVNTTPKDGKITIKETEFKKFLEKAYEDGYEDGYDKGRQYMPYWYGGTTLTSTATAPYTIKYNDTTFDPYKVTCACSGEATNCVGD